jgi:hypothetical protein
MSTASARRSCPATAVPSAICSLAPAGFGLTQPSGAQQQLGEVVPRQRIPRIRRDGAHQAVHRCVHIALHRPRKREVREGHALARLDLERALVMRDGAVEIALLREQETEVVMRGGVVWIAFDGGQIRHSRAVEIAAKVLPRALVARRARGRVDLVRVAALAGQ